MPALAQDDETGKIFQETESGWEPVDAIRNDDTGEISIDDGNDWVPLEEYKSRPMVSGGVRDESRHRPVESYEGMGVMDVAGRAASNLPASYGEEMTHLRDLVMHPIKTARSIADLGSSIVSHFMDEDDPDAKLSQDVGNAIIQAYGTVNGFKKNVSENPIRVMGDLAAVLIGGGGAFKLVSSSEKLSKLGEKMSNLGQASDPIIAGFRATGKVAKGLGHLGSETVGMLTGTGGRALRDAASEGFNAPLMGKTDFSRSMRNQNAPMEVVDEIRSHYKARASESGKAFQADLAKWIDDPTILNYDKIKSSHLAEMRRYKTGVTDILKTGDNADWSNKINKILKTFEEDIAKAGEPMTAKQLYGLKKSLQDMGLEAGQGTMAVNAVKTNLIKLLDEELSRVPHYKATMISHAKRAERLKLFDKEMSLNAANKATTLRKVLSSNKQNVNTAGGIREELVDTLSPGLMKKVSGASLSQVMPGGIMRGVGGMAFGGAAMTANPAWLGFMGMQSPRLMGETAYLGGRIAGLGGAIPSLQKVMTNLGVSPGKLIAGTEGLLGIGHYQKDKAKKRREAKRKKKKKNN